MRVNIGGARFDTDDVLLYTAKHTTISYWIEIIFKSEVDGKAVVAQTKSFDTRDDRDEELAKLDLFMGVVDANAGGGGMKVTLCPDCDWCKPEQAEWLKTFGFKFEEGEGNFSDFLRKTPSNLDIEVESMEKLVEITKTVRELGMGCVIIGEGEHIPRLEIFSGYLE